MTQIIPVPVDNFVKLKQTIEWYDKMPSFLDVGDRFHENMSEEIENLLPAIDELDNQDYYNGGIEVVDGKMFMTLVHELDPGKEIECELIPV